MSVTHKSRLTMATMGSFIVAVALEAVASIVSMNCEGVFIADPSGPLLDCINPCAGGCQSNISVNCPDPAGVAAAACQCYGGSVSPCCHIVFCFEIDGDAFPDAAGDCRPQNLSCPPGSCNHILDMGQVPPEATAQCD